MIDAGRSQGHDAVAMPEPTPFAAPGFVLNPNVTVNASGSGQAPLPEVCDFASTAPPTLRAVESALLAAGFRNLHKVGAGANVVGIWIVTPSRATEVAAPRPSAPTPSTPAAAAPARAEPRRRGNYDLACDVYLALG